MEGRCPQRSHGREPEGSQRKRVLVSARGHMEACGDGFRLSEYKILGMIHKSKMTHPPFHPNVLEECESVFFNIQNTKERSSNNIQWWKSALREKIMTFITYPNYKDLHISTPATASRKQNTPNVETTTSKIKACGVGILKSDNGVGNQWGRSKAASRCGWGYPTPSLWSFLDTELWGFWAVWPCGGE